MIRLITILGPAYSVDQLLFTFHIMIRLITTIVSCTTRPPRQFTFHIMIRLITRAHKGFMH